MKNLKKLKLILIILICILIILFGFIGAYKKVGNRYKNILPSFKFASDITGATVMEFEVDTTEDTTYYDEDGNEIDEDSIDDVENYTTKETPVNSDEVLTADNYKKVVKIMKKRLEFLQADQYQIDLDEETGKIVLTIDDDYIEDVESLLPLEGRLKLVDSETEDVIIDYTDFEEVEATYASLDEGYETYISLKLNDSGLEKMKEIEKYKTVQTNESETEDTETTEQSVEETTESESEEETTTESTLQVLFDEDEICDVSYDDILLSGKILRITTESEITDTSSIQSELNVNTVVSELATYGKMPVVYNLSAEEFVKPDVLYFNNIIIITLIVLAAIMAIYFIIRYKLNGVFATLGFATTMALIYLLIKVTDVEISLNAIAGAILILFMNLIIISNILKNIRNKEKAFVENIKKAYFDSLNTIIIILIIFIVFAFSSMTVINSLGLMLFWGWIITILGNLCFTVPMLSIINE